MFQINITPKFDRKYQKLIKRNKSISSYIEIAINKLSIDPFDKKLKSHKVETQNNGYQYSSKINSDLRIIWNFNEDVYELIDLIDIGGHSGKNKVYK